MTAPAHQALPPPPTEPAGPRTPSAPAPRSRARSALRTAATVLVLAGSLYFLVRSITCGPAGTAAAVRWAGPWLLLAELPVLAGLWVTALAWRAPLRHLSGPLTAPRAVQIFAAGQLGKYVPGVAWSIILQARLACGARITTAQITAAFGVYAVVSVATGAALGLPAAVLRTEGLLPALLAVGAAAAVLAAAPLLLDRGLALLRRIPAVARRLAPVPRATLRQAVGLSTASWLLSGLHLWLLAVALGAGPSEALVPCLGGFALSTAVSSLVVVVPDGIGVRESVLAVALTTCLPPAEAAGAAIASRLLLAVGDVLAFGYGSWAARGARSRNRTRTQPTIGDRP